MTDIARPSKNMLAHALERVAVYRQSNDCTLPYQNSMIALADEIERLTKALDEARADYHHELAKQHRPVERAWALDNLHLALDREPPHCSTCCCGIKASCGDPRCV